MFGIGFMLMTIGAMMAASESLLIPALIVATGIAMMYVAQRGKEDPDE